MSFPRADDNINAMAANPRTGDIWFGGFFASPVFTFGFGTQFLTVSNSDATGASGDAWLGLYNTNNYSVMALYKIGSSGQNEGIWSLQIDDNDNLYVVGAYSSASITVGGVTISNPAAGKDDAFVAKFAYMNSMTTALWVKSFSGIGWNILYTSDLSFTQDGLFVCGLLSSSMVVDGVTYSGAGSTNDIWIAKLSTATGSAMWVKQFGALGDDVCRSIRVDRSNASTQGSVIIVGYQNLALTAGSYTLTPNSNSYDGLAIRLDGSTGSVLWATNMGGSGQDVLYGLAVDSSSGAIYATGYVISTAVVFNGVTVTKTGTGSSIWVAKYNPNGSQAWLRIYSAGSAANDNGLYLTVDPATGYVYVAANKNSASLTFGTTTVTSVVFTLILDSSGNVVKVTPMSGATSGGNNNFCMIDPWNEYWVAGALSNSDNVVLNTITYTKYGNYDAYCALYDINMNALMEPVI